MTKRIAYWSSTCLLAAVLLSGGMGELSLRPETVAGMRLLGYPPYFLQIIGFWKVLGGAAILAPRLPRLKEWVYAGVFFNMTGAAASHLVAGSAAWHVILTGMFALLTLASWALRPAERVVGVLAQQVFPGITDTAICGIESVQREA